MFMEEGEPGPKEDIYGDTNVTELTGDVWKAYLAPTPLGRLLDAFWAFFRGGWGLERFKGRLDSKHNQWKVRLLWHIVFLECFV